MGNSPPADSNAVDAIAVKVPAPEAAKAQTNKPLPKMSRTQNTPASAGLTPKARVVPAKRSVLSRLGSAVLNIALFCVGTFFPETATKGLRLVPFNPELGIYVMIRTLSYTVALVASVAALKLVFGVRPTRMVVAQPLPATMWGIAGSWIWVLNSVLRYGQPITPDDKPKLWSLAGMTAASIGPLLMV
ncbi:hypothetical protein CC85DRAFT_286011 [Cutaneotrichosporon oleaginosum]|uniref:Uncharacterized protein n=1 Tax=Cutaneotrichosporon oleaginosum TaxID=879819 RepID=A0A0J0XLF7_9TREE|nr:uncharacterized protein CC85DRAFT_286011 [Cutaneotrichosporon oleaginosum]KLT41922.1 hypothetical protein CC85DRAFT_286011 [Cutaneotrichosporon oleaginosum]TXT12522.1 hypothetical protein COLE_02932 [Cutaneotrichosporon oleaginosum]